MKCLITGGAGFIGSHLAEELRRQDHEVVIFDNFASGKGNLNILETAGVKIIEGNVVDFQAIKDASEGVGVVFHLAAMNRFQRSVEKPLESFEVNCVGTSNVLESARQNNVKQVIFTSSSSVYGDSDEFPRKETGKTDPSHNYGASKLVGELYCKTYQKLYGLNTTILRYFSVYGPRQRGDIDYAAVIPKFVLNSLGGKPLTVYGDGSQKRSFTYVDDNVRATVSAMLNQKTYGEIINVSSAEETSINELVKTVRRIMNVDTGIETLPLPKGDIEANSVDVAKAKRLLGWEPSVSIDEGVDRLVKWYKAYYSK